MEGGAGCKVQAKERVCGLLPDRTAFVDHTAALLFVKGNLSRTAGQLQISCSCLGERTFKCLCGGGGEERGGEDEEIRSSLLWLHLRLF